MYFALEEDAPDKIQAAKKALSFSFKWGEARGRFNIVLDADTPDNFVAIEQQLSKAALQEAYDKLGGRNLPIGALCFQTVQSSGDKKIVFWYPAMSQPDRLWQQFKEKLQKVYSL